MTFRDYIVSEGFVYGTLSDEDYFKQMTAWSGFEFIPKLTTEMIDMVMLEDIKESLVKMHTFLPLGISEDAIELLICSPDYMKLKDTIGMTYQRKVVFKLTYRSELTQMIGTLYNRSNDVLTDINELASTRTSQHQYLSEDDVLNDDTVRKFIIKLIKDAQSKRSSDIHLVPTKDGLEVYFRIDNVYTIQDKISLNALAPVMVTLKNECGLRSYETRRPQDGQFVYNLGNDKEVNIRTAFLNGVYGESLTMRIMDSDNSIRTAEDLGIDKSSLELLRTATRRSQGLVLVTGPTGSGKSTTIHALLNELIVRGKIITIEDPVEKKNDRLVQIQVDDEIEFGFSEILRRVLRHDPDIIFIGEIRDALTASMAIRAGMTGHLVLSTLHTNDSISSIHRLLDLDISHEVIAESLSCVVSQRLVRKVCDECAEEHVLPADSRHRRTFNIPDSTHVTYRSGSGCKLCNNTGYRGRIVIKEIMFITDELRNLIRAGSKIEDYRDALERADFRDIKDDALSRVLNGITTFEEVEPHVI